MAAVRPVNEFPCGLAEVALCRTTGLVHIKKEAASDGAFPQRGFVLRFARVECPLPALACIRAGQVDPCPHWTQSRSGAVGRASSDRKRRQKAAAAPRGCIRDN